MAGTLDDYKKEAFSDNQNLCKDYRNKWEECRNKKDHIDMMMSTTGLDYTCDAIHKGWGLSQEYLKANFGMFMNGKYISNQQRYDSRLYCGYKGCITADVTVICIIGGEVDIVVPDWQFVHLYVSDKARISIKGNGRVVLNHYGAIAINGQHPSRINNKNWRIINKEERDNY